MESASDAVSFDPLVIWFNTGWLIGDVSSDGECSNPLSMVTQVLYLQQATVRNILSLTVRLVSQMEFRLHGEIILVHSGAKASDYLLFLHLFYFITTSELNYL